METLGLQIGSSAMLPVYLVNIPVNRGGPTTGGLRPAGLQGLPKNLLSETLSDMTEFAALRRRQESYNDA
jgi:hypothetical protein